MLRLAARLRGAACRWPTPPALVSPAASPLWPGCGGWRGAATQASSSGPPSTADGGRIVVACVLERGPVVVPDLPPWEREFNVRMSTSQYRRRTRRQRNSGRPSLPSSHAPSSAPPSHLPSPPPGPQEWRESRTARYAKEYPESEAETSARQLHETLLKEGDHLTGEEAEVRGGEGKDACLHWLYNLAAALWLTDDPSFILPIHQVQVVWSMLIGMRSLTRILGPIPTIPYSSIHTHCPAPFPHPPPSITPLRCCRCPGRLRRGSPPLR